jgi:hypothetical protein
MCKTQKHQNCSSSRKETERLSERASDLRRLHDSRSLYKGKRSDTHCHQSCSGICLFGYPQKPCRYLLRAVRPVSLTSDATYTPWNVVVVESRWCWLPPNPYVVWNEWKTPPLIIVRCCADCSDQVVYKRVGLCQRGPVTPIQHPWNSFDMVHDLAFLSCFTDHHWNSMHPWLC